MWPDTIYSNYLTNIRHSVLFSRRPADHLADRVSLGGKTFFIFCHDISHHHILLVVQIKGMCQKSPSFRFCHFLEGKFKQIFIVRFKFYRFTSCQNLTVTSQKFLEVSLLFA